MKTIFERDFFHFGLIETYYRTTRLLSIHIKYITLTTYNLLMSITVNCTLLILVVGGS
jgi:hypothetical protein